MCKFFSCLSDGFGNLKYLDWSIRQRILNLELELEPDSHTSIAAYFGLAEDKCNRWEYNPLTQVVTLDWLNTRDDSDLVRDNLALLNFKTIVPQLVVKPIVNPFEVKRGEAVSENEIALLKKWISVRASVGTWTTVWDSVMESVCASVGTSVWAAVHDWVWEYVWDCDSNYRLVKAWVRYLVWESVRESVWASTGSFFKLPRQDWKYTGAIQCEGYPFEPAAQLWEAGLVPSFDGQTWRLHAGRDAHIVYEMKS